MNSATVPTIPDPPEAASGLSRPADDPSTGSIAPHSPPAIMQLDRYDNSSFDRGAGRLKEALWILCRCLFFQNPFPWPSSLRVALLRFFGAHIGRHVVIRCGVTVTFPWRLAVGDHVWIGDEVLILSLAPVTIGSNVCLSQRAFLCTGSHAWRTETFELRTRPIVIADRVWISAQAFIGAGTTIGSDSVVSAGTILTQSIPAHSFAKGNPAVIQSTFPGGDPPQTAHPHQNR